MQGHHFLNLDISLDVGQLKQPLRACIAGEAKSQEASQNTTNRRGKNILCKIMMMPLISRTDGTQGAVLMMEEADPSSDGR